MTERIPLLVLGLGNVLLEDDGVGSVTVARLADRFTWPGTVTVHDGGTLGLSLLPWVEQADAVILVDAVRTDDPPGTRVRLDGEAVGPAVATRLSPHQVGVADLLDGARWRNRYPREVVLLGLVPASIELGVGLTPAVAAGIDALAADVVAEATRLGFPFAPRGPQNDECGSTETHTGFGRVPDVARLAGLPVGTGR